MSINGERTAKVVRDIPRPIDQVFEAISNHAGYDELPCIDSARLLSPGKSEKNGLGALREIKANHVCFTEEITRFEPPYRMDYLVKECQFYGLPGKLTLPAGLDHREGRIDLVADGKNSTRVLWISRYYWHVPFVGKQLSYLVQPLVEKTFGDILDSLKEKLA